MDLELSDEQTWLAESVETLLRRHWVEPGAVWEADDAARALVWTELVEFGALSVGDDGLAAVELCLIGRALGKHLAATPFIASAGIRWAAAPLLDELPAVATQLLEDADSVALASPDGAAVEHAESAELLVVAAPADRQVLLVRPGLAVQPKPSFDPSIPVATIDHFEADVVAGGEAALRLLERLATIGALLAAAEAVGASGRLLDDAIAYAGERKQFGHTIGHNQALRHLLADMYVRQASSWSTVLYAAATLDEGAADAAQTVAIAKAYVSRAAREVAHGALQVFGGIAFTAEHPAHRFLRRIVVRERQFGDAAHHERALGRALGAHAGAGAAIEEPPSLELAEDRA
jgi:acyl-CoA dehydrogenase-like protein